MGSRFLGMVQAFSRARIQFSLKQLDDAELPGLAPSPIPVETPVSAWDDFPTDEAIAGFLSCCPQARARSENPPFPHQQEVTLLMPGLGFILF